MVGQKRGRYASAVPAVTSDWSTSEILIAPQHTTELSLLDSYFLHLREMECDKW